MRRRPQGRAAGLRNLPLALALAECAERIFRHRVKEGDDRTLERLATAQMNRAITLRHLKRLDEALTAYDEALALRRELVAASRAGVSND